MSVGKKVVAGMALIAGTATRAASVVKKRLEKFNDHGEELVDGRSMEPPLGYEPSESLAEQIARAVRSHAIQQAIADAGGETEEEANDFDVGDDFDPTSPYEAYFEPITESEFDRLIKSGRFTFPREPSPEPLATPQASPEPPKGAGAVAAQTAPAGPPAAPKAS